MGRVYLARDRWLGRMVALKEAHDERLARRLAREVRVTAGLEHPGIVTVYDEGRGADGRLFYTMRLMRGRPLSRMLAERATLGERLGLLSHYLDACNALAYAHAQGVIHRDLKPDNIMLGAFGETQVVDWGLARRVDGGAAEGHDEVELGGTRPGAVLGTPAYMSPEQAHGEPADRRSDVWGLGAVLYELLTGAPPRAGREALRTGPAAAVVGTPRAPGREVPAELAAIVTRALARDPDARYPDAEALAADVAAYLGGRRVDAHRYSALEIGLRFVRAWRVPLLVAAAALVVIAALLTIGTLNLRAQRDRALAAEDGLRAALAISDHNLATALVAQARAADDRGDHAAKEVIASHALRLVDSPEARGLLAGARAAARPTRIATAAIPDCYPLVALSVDDILCGEDHTLRRLTAGVERWRVQLARPLKELRVEAGRVWAVASGFDMTTFALDDGAPADEAWEVVDYNVGAAWPVRLGEWRGQASPRPHIAASCGAGHVIGLSGLLDGSYAVLCADGQLGLARGASPPDFGPAFDPARFVTFTHLQLSPDARRVVVAGVQGRVEVQDLATRETWVRTTSTRDPVRRLEISPAGDRVAIVRERGGVELYELPGLQPLGTIAAAQVRDVRLFADGSVLVASASKATLWALPGAPRPGLLADDHGLSGVVFAPDGRSLVTTHGEGRALLWDLATGLRRHELEIGTGTVKAASFLADGQRFAVVDAGTGPPGPHIFDVATGARQWSPPPELLRYWNRVRAVIDETMTVLMARRVVTLTGDVLVFALYGPGVLAVDVATSADVAVHDCPRIEWQDLASAPEGLRAVLVSVAGTVHIVDPGAPLRCRPVAAPPGASAADVSADGELVVVGGSRFLARTGPAGLRWSVPHPGAWPLDVALSPDGRWIASAGPDEAARVWDAETGALRALLTGHKARVAAVEFSPDGQLLATGSWDGTARMWEMATLEMSVESLARAAEVTWGLALAEALGG